MTIYTFTSDQLLQVIKLAFEIGHGHPGGVGPVTAEWPMKILRLVEQCTREEREGMKGFPPEFNASFINAEDLFA